MALLSQPAALRNRVPAHYGFPAREDPQVRADRGSQAHGLDVSSLVTALSVVALVLNEYEQRYLYHCMQHCSPPYRYDVRRPSLSLVVRACHRASRHWWGWPRQLLRIREDLLWTHGETSAIVVRCSSLILYHRRCQATSSPVARLSAGEIPSPNTLCNSN